MIPPFDADGNLPPGIHWAEWQEFEVRFGQTAHRRGLLRGLRSALDSLKQAGCMTAYVDGSFATSKVAPGDYDVCWDEMGVAIALLHPALRTFTNGRALQKATFGGELFPATAISDTQGSIYLEFFQIDRNTGRRKGIVALDLRRMP